MKKCSASPSAAVGVPPSNAAGPRRPLATDCRRRVGGTLARMYENTMAYVMSKEPPIRPPIRMDDRTRLGIRGPPSRDGRDDTRVPVGGQGAVVERACPSHLLWVQCNHLGRRHESTPHTDRQFAGDSHPEA